MLDTTARSMTGAGRTASARQTSRLSALPSKQKALPADDSSQRRTETKPRRLVSSSSPSAKMARSEARLVTGAICCAVVLCGLIVVYLAAYAHVTSLGIAQSKMRTQLRVQRQENETLNAQVADLQNPDRISALAVKLGMTPTSTRVDYIVPPRPIHWNRQSAVASALAGDNQSQPAPMGLTAFQGTDNGTTSNDSSTSDGH